MFFYLKKIFLGISIKGAFVKTKILFLSLLLIFSKVASSGTQSLAILGGYGNTGDLSQTTEYFDKATGTWKQAYLVGGNHPWGLAAGTNQWVNYKPSFFLGLNTTTDYRIRFFVPEDFSQPKMNFIIKADNEAWLKLNGVELGHVVGSNTGAAGDALLKGALKIGLNEITLTMADYGGWVGLNYRIDIEVQSELPMTIQPAIAPTANAGVDQSARVNDTITLDGSSSSAKDGKLLSYVWQFASKPAGSSAELSAESTVNPSFKLDKSGDYLVRLVVNDGTLSSVADVVKVSTVNSIPFANAGSNQSGKIADIVTLDGSASSDDDGDLLVYNWTVVSKPSDSSIVLSNHSLVNPSFSIDKSGSYVIQLIVNDGIVDSAPVMVTISTVNSAPVANAGLNQSGRVSDLINLDGSASFDVDGDLLGYAWMLTSIPAGSNAILSDPSAVNPSFTIDKFGTYVAQLIVHDKTSASIPATVVISTINTIPVANAGMDQAVYVGSSATLNGSASDVDGDSLTYHWSFLSTPSGSVAQIADPTALTTNFIADLAGAYVLQFVTNDGTADSQTSTMTVSSTNLAPIAEAGDDQAISVIGSAVKLNGSQSYDPNGDTISYQWSILSKPDGSVATLDSESAISPEFIADIHGMYITQLIVMDQWGIKSVPSTITISFNNIAPIANAGMNQSGVVGNRINLNGSSSVDANGDTLEYVWSFTSIPNGSAAQLFNANFANAFFVPDVDGIYQVQLIVNDGFVSSAPNTVQVVEISMKTQTINGVQTCQSLVSGLSKSVFANKDQQKTITQKLNSIIKEINEHEYRDALSTLKNDLVRKVNGCTTTSNADKNDWIKSCQAQTSVYACFQNVVADLITLANTQPLRRGEKDDSIEEYNHDD